MASGILSVRGLRVHFPVKRGIFSKTVDTVKAVDEVDFDVPRGKTVGLVGESGSGKSTIGKAIIRLVQADEGSILFDNKELLMLPWDRFFPFRRRIQMIFQDPFNSLNPRMTVGDIIREPMDIHFPQTSVEKKNRKVADLLDRVGLPRLVVNRYPHQFSGGQRQRIGIARALSVDPEFIICDESVSALDVSVQAQIVNLLQDLQKERNLTYLFIAHDLAVVEHISDEVLVMNQGKLVEKASSEKLYENPQDPYTRKLLDAVPKMETVVAAAKEGTQAP